MKTAPHPPKDGLGDVHEEEVWGRALRGEQEFEV